MITGAHSIIYSTNADADRAFFKNVLKLPSVDVGGGWLIFGLPPAEVAMHESDKNGVHELYLMCNDVEAFVVEMERRGVACTPVSEQDWGLLTQVTLPGGSQLGVYEPRHARPETSGEREKPARRAAKRAAKRSSRGKAKRAAKIPVKKPKRAEKKRAKGSKRAVKRRPKRK